MVIFIFTSLRFAARSSLLKLNDEGTVEEEEEDFGFFVHTLEWMTRYILETLLGYISFTGIKITNPTTSLVLFHKNYLLFSGGGRT